jgi:hypothetical protein
MAVVKGSALLSSVEALFENTESIVIAAFQVCGVHTQLTQALIRTCRLLRVCFQHFTAYSRESQQLGAAGAEQPSCV